MSPISATTYWVRSAVIDGHAIEDARIDVDTSGAIVRAGNKHELSNMPPFPLVRDLGLGLLVPGMVNAHSHAFQRMIRGQTQRTGVDDPSTFWSWRQAMYQTAMRLDPSGLYTSTLAAYREMLRAGITTVGEFHYIHHQPDGTPYDDPNEMSWQVVRAAQDAGIRLVLLEVFYSRAGTGRGPLPEQRRFCDRSVDEYGRRVEELRANGVDVAIAPHSVRAVSLPELQVIAEFANAHDLVCHAHVSEQTRENQECEAEHGMTPTAVLAQSGFFDRRRRFCAVHAIHITPEDIAMLAQQSVCACPTTEADLGDGIVRGMDLRRAGAGLALGSDSNSVIDLIQEARLLEMHERLRTRSRVCMRDEHGRVAETLLGIATAGGAAALGRGHRCGSLAVGYPFDAALFDLDHPLFAGIDPAYAVDTLVTCGTAAAVHKVFVGGVETS